MMDPTVVSEEKCSECGISLRKKPRHEKVFSNSVYFCRPCYRRKFELARKEESKTEIPITLSFKCTPKGHSRCIFSCKPGESLRVLQKKTRISVFIKHRLFVFEKCRACSSHFDGDELNGDFVSNFMDKTVLDDVKLTPSEIVGVIDDLRLGLDSLALEQEEEQWKSCDFFEKTEDVSVWTGLQKPQFDELASYIKLKKENPAKQRLILGAYLMHLYVDLSEARIATLLCITQQCVSKYVRRARDSLSEFVALFLDGVKRTDVMKETTEILRILHQVPKNSDNILTVWDGTYIFLPKSSNFRFQRVTYSGHKKTNYLKPMLAVSTSGLIVNVLGPERLWAGSMSDADIFKSCINLPWFKNFFKPGDIFVLDRGFQRAEEDLLQGGFKISIPVSKGGNAQLTTLEANLSRICTKIRWVIESVNSSLKRFKYFKHTVPSEEVPFLFADIRVVSAIHNRYFSRLSSDGDRPEVARRMLELLNTPNTVQLIVENEHLIRKTIPFERLNETHFENLPVWNPQDLASFSGSYQIGVSMSYIADHFNTEKREFLISRDNHLPNFKKYKISITKPFFMKAKLLSRHISNKVYSIFILFDLAKKSADAFKESFCTCKNGARTMNPCAHAMALIWYLLYGRHEARLRCPAAFLNKCFPLLKSDALCNLESDDEN